MINDVNYLQMKIHRHLKRLFSDTLNEDEIVETIEIVQRLEAWRMELLMKRITKPIDDVSAAFKALSAACGVLSAAANMAAHFEQIRKIKLQPRPRFITGSFQYENKPELILKANGQITGFAPAYNPKSVRK